MGLCTLYLWLFWACPDTGLQPLVQYNSLIYTFCFVLHTWYNLVPTKPAEGYFGGHPQIYMVELMKCYKSSRKISTIGPNGIDIINGVNLVAVNTKARD